MIKSQVHHTRQKSKQLPSKNTSTLDSSRRGKALHQMLNSQDKKSILKNCVFCQKLIKMNTASFSILLNKALFSKYSSSQNYYYSKDINDILEGESTPATIKYYDIELIVEQEEYLKRYYIKSELRGKVNSLLEYYKYHKDIPRLYMNPEYEAINRFHDKRRRLEYARIKKNLNLPYEDEYTNHDKLDKNHSKDKEKDMSVRQMKNLLIGLKIFEEPIIPFLSQNSKQKHKEDQINQNSITIQLKDLLTQIVDKKRDNKNIVSLSFIEQSMTQFGARQIDDISQISSTNSKFVKGIINDHYHSSFTNPIEPRKVQSLKMNSNVYVPTLNLNQLAYSKEETQYPKQKQISNNTSGLSKQSLQIKQLADVQRQLLKTGALTDRVPATQSQKQKMPQSLHLKQQTYTKESITSRQQPLQDFDDRSSKQEISNQIIQNRATSQYIYNPVNIQVTTPASQCNELIEKKKVNYPKYADYHVLSQYNLTKPIQKNNHQKTLSQGSIINTSKKNLQTNRPLVQKPSSTQVTTQIVQKTQVHVGRTKSQDNIQSQAANKGSPQKPQSKPQTERESKSRPVSLFNNVFVQQKKTPSIYTINQNNIVNIYLDDIRSSIKSIKFNGGAQTLRVQSPQKVQGIRKIIDCDQNQNQISHQSPVIQKKK